MRGGRRSAAGRPMIVVSVVAAVTLLLGGAGARAATRNQPAAKARSTSSPTFANFAAPSGLGQDSGEPSIGVDRATGNVMFQAGLETLRINNFDPTTNRAT